MMAERLSVKVVAQALSRLVAFKAHSGLTFCNEFLQAVSMTQGNADFNGLLIAQIHEKMKLERWNYRPLDAIEAQEDANCGKLIYAIWSDPEPEVTDHGSIVIPGEICWSKQFEDDVPMIANVGKTNFYGRPASFGFRKTMKPEYYLWLGG